MGDHNNTDVEFIQALAAVLRENDLTELEVSRQTGEVLWTVPFEVNFGTSIACPIFAENLLLVSSYYEGSLAIRRAGLIAL